jgi:quinol monooxygenase YgiN
MTNPYILTVTFQPKPEHLAAFAELMDSVKNELPKVEGCLNLRILRQDQGPTTFLLIEDWQSAELHDAQIARLVASGDWAAIEAMLRCPPITTVLSEV